MKDKKPTMPWARSTDTVAITANMEGLPENRAIAVRYATPALAAYSRPLLYASNQELILNPRTTRIPIIGLVIPISLRSAMTPSSKLGSTLGGSSAASITIRPLLQRRRPVRAQYLRSLRSSRYKVPLKSGSAGRPTWVDLE